MDTLPALALAVMANSPDQAITRCFGTGERSDWKHLEFDVPTGPPHPVVRRHPSSRKRPPRRERYAGGHGKAVA